jgi:uncharacterized protein DUF2330
MKRVLLSIAAVTAGLAIFAGPAVACGGLVGENGSIQLVRTATLAAYHDGVERYVTSFKFVGEGAEVGSIIPLPDVPTSVVRGGDWTLQRLGLEVAPPRREAVLAASAAGTTSASATVILETKIDALDITVLEGGAAAVGQWALEHGFFLTPDAPEVLEFYASRSPIFMAARFDARRAKALGQRSGDGTPIMLTIPTDQPWVPLRILALGQPKSQVVDADVFLLTDDKPTLLAGGSGLSLERSESARPALLDDLRSDKGMEWVPQSMWFSYLRVAATAGDLDYDLAVSSNAKVTPARVDTGLARPVSIGSGEHLARWPIVLGVLSAAAAIFLLAGWTAGGRRRTP